MGPCRSGHGGGSRGECGIEEGAEGEGAQVGDKGAGAEGPQTRDQAIQNRRQEAVLDKELR